jgi:hypothetical protein
MNSFRSVLVTLKVSTDTNLILSERKKKKKNSEIRNMTLENLIFPQTLVFRNLYSVYRSTGTFFSTYFFLFERLRGSGDIDILP